MDIAEPLKRSLSSLSNVNSINNTLFKNITKNCFCVLKGKPEVHSMNGLLGSKPNVVKDVYAALLSATAAFVRQGAKEEEIVQFLSNECNFPSDRCQMYNEMYLSNKQDIEIALINVGTHLPHVTDVNWKIDYLVKSSISDESGGPLIRVALLTEAYDEEIKGKKMEYVNFTCTVQELQDLVYKLKDAVRHCQHIGTEH